MRIKHINLRYFTIKEKIQEFEIVIKHLPTKNMLADIFTKSLLGKLFANMRDKLFNLV